MLEYTTELIFQKRLMLIKQVCQKNVIFVTIGILEGIGFKYEPHLCIGCHDLMQKAMSFNTLLLFMLKEVLTEFIVGIFVKMMQLT